MSNIGSAFSAGCLCQEFCWPWILLCCDYFKCTISFKFLLCHFVLRWGLWCLIFFPLISIPFSVLCVPALWRGFVLHPQKSHSLFLQYPMVTQMTFIQCVTEFIGTGMPGGKNNWESFWRLPTIRKILKFKRREIWGTRGIFDHLYFHFNTS